MLYAGRRMELPVYWINLRMHDVGLILDDLTERDKFIPTLFISLNTEENWHGT